MTTTQRLVNHAMCHSFHEAPVRRYIARDIVHARHGWVYVRLARVTLFTN